METTIKASEWPKIEADVLAGRVKAFTAHGDQVMAKPEKAEPMSFLVDTRAEWWELLQFKPDDVFTIEQQQITGATFGGLPEDVLKAIRRIWDLTLIKDDPSDDAYDALYKISTIARDILLNYDAAVKAAYDRNRQYDERE